MLGKKAAKEAAAAKKEAKLVELIGGLQAAVLSLTGKVDAMGTDIKRLRKQGRKW